MLRTFVTITNTQQSPGGPNAGNKDQAFVEVNGIIYDNYKYANPTVGELSAVPTAEFPSPLVRAREFLDANFYRIFYPMPDDAVAVKNNPWVALSASQCGDDQGSNF